MLLYTCQKDDTVVDSVQSDGQQFKIEILNENNLRENNSLSAKITQIKRSFESKQGSNSSARERFGFLINTDSIKYIEELETGKHSYNFPMSADSLGRVRNFVLASQGNGAYDAHVLIYGFTADEFPLLDGQDLSERPTMFSSKLDLDSLIQDPSSWEKVYAGWECVEVWGQVNVVEHNGDLHGAPDENGKCTVPGCNFGGTEWVIVSQNCQFSGGGGNENGGNTGEPGGTPGNGQNPVPYPGAPGNNVVTPTFCRGCPEIDVEGEEEECPNSLELASMINGLSLTPQQTSFLMGNCDLAQPAYDYWSNGGDDDFVKLAIQAIMENPSMDFDKILHLTNGMDKECQARELFKSIYQINSTFTNKIKNYFLSSNSNNLNLQDLANGESVNDEPPMNSSIAARVLPAPAVNGSIIMQFNDTHIDSSTTLGFVNTFYHELVHAYILRLYFTGQLLNEYPSYTALNTAINNFMNDFYNVELSEVYDKEMHDVFIDFIDPIAESIVAYCDYNDIEGVDLTYAKKLVWGSLNGNDVFFENLTPAQQTEAQNLLAYENFNITANAKGTKTCD